MSALLSVHVRGSYQYEVGPVARAYVATGVPCGRGVQGHGTSFPRSARLLSTPWLARSSMAGSENCTIGIPEAARNAPPALSVRRWGAWSVAMVSMRPSCRAALRASRSLRRFNGRVALDACAQPPIVGRGEEQVCHASLGGDALAAVEGLGAEEGQLAGPWTGA